MHSLNLTTTLSFKPIFRIFIIKDTHREKSLSNKIKALTKSMNMDYFGTKQLFIRGSETETKFSKNKVVTGKTPFFVISPFCTNYPICLNIGS